MNFIPSQPNDENSNDQHDETFKRSMTAQEMIKMNDMPKPMSESQEKIDH